MSKRVVVTGLGVVSPVGKTPGEFYKNLTSGVCGIGPITRFDASGFKVSLAAEVKDFSPEFYGISHKDASHMDLFTQFAVAAARDAVEDSGIAGTIDPERFGVYVGSGIGGMNTFTAESRKLFERGPDRVSPFFIPMLISNIAAGQISIRFNAQGPSLPVATACATSTNSIGEAFRAVSAGWADAIIAGGTEAAIEPLGIAGFINCKALSLATDPKRASIPFDKERNGFIMGEGAGIVVLEEYERAKARGAKIYAEAVGYGNTLDAYHVTHPRPDAAPSSRAIKQAAEQAGILPGERVYFNAHGTSTPVNDTTETKAIKTALGEERARTLKISSTKSMTGHMLGAAGAIEAIASILTLREGVVPPTIGYAVPDPECDLDYTVNEAARFDPALAISVSLGFGGHNACLAFRKV
ncbi:MAG: beta-ketoacyl-ACP synthase II [Clostridiales bacterium]|jgi:3-oxoacyl-[acyl-carrier-protein] synthase II|nr:beta-ketoacyl-ACP synthase II [Clostridiales bacterium]